MGRSRSCRKTTDVKLTQRQSNEQRCPLCREGLSEEYETRGGEKPFRVKDDFLSEARRKFGVSLSRARVIWQKKAHPKWKERGAPKKPLR